jgi:hypothetical protein
MLSGCTQLTGTKGNMNEPYNIFVIQGKISGYLKKGEPYGPGAICDAMFLYDSINFTDKSVSIFDHNKLDKSRIKWLIIYSFSVNDPEHYDCPIGDVLWSYSTPSNKKIDLSSGLRISGENGADTTHSSESIISLDLSSSGVMISNSKVVFAEDKSNDTIGFNVIFHNPDNPIEVSYIYEINYEFHENWDKDKITIR